MNYFSFFLLGGCLLLSCTNENTTAQSKQRQIKIKTIDQNGNEKTVEWNGEGEMPEEIKAHMNTNEMDSENMTALASLSIEGMSCQKMCAGSIQKELTNHPGVLSCVVNFDDKKAEVSFDASKTNEKNLISVIHGIHDGKYKVTEVELRKEIIKAEES